MNHYCHCGHLPRDHYGDSGRCEADDDDRPCMCPFYDHDTDD